MSRPPRALRTTQTRTEARAALFGIVGSVILHGAFVLYATLYLNTPDLGFEFELPLEVELGLTDEAVVGGEVAAPAEPLVAPADEPTPTDESAEDAEESRRDAGPRRTDGGAGDGGGADGGVDAGLDGGAALVASAETEGAHGESPSEATRLPAGAQIALRLDLARIRVSPLAPDVRRLLDAIPDWSAVLDGADIDPIDDLDRVLIASPNLSRSRMVLAGRYETDRIAVRDVVQRMAAARGVTAQFHTEDGVEVAPWANADETTRVLALVGPRHFTITRPEDLGRVLAIARVRAEEAAATATEGEPELSGADALLSMEEGEAFSVEVEGARRFVRGQTRGIPSRVRLSVRELEDHSVRFVAQGTFDDAAQAEEARDFWSQTRDGYARNAMVALIGMADPLRRTELTVDGAVLRAETTLSQRQIRLVLSYVEGLLADQSRRRPGASPTPPTAPTLPPTRLPAPSP